MLKRKCIAFDMDTKELKERYTTRKAINQTNTYP